MKMELTNEKRKGYVVCALMILVSCLYLQKLQKSFNRLFKRQKRSKKMDISMLCCVVMRSLYGSVVSRMRFLPKLTDICRMEKNWKNAEEKIFISQGLRESEE